MAKSTHSIQTFLKILASLATVAEDEASKIDEFRARTCARRTVPLHYLPPPLPFEKEGESSWNLSKSVQVFV